jgi:hypothetical protein
MIRLFSELPLCKTVFLVILREGYNIAFTQYAVPVEQLHWMQAFRQQLHSVKSLGLGPKLASLHQNCERLKAIVGLNSCSISTLLNNSMRWHFTPVHAETRTQTFWLRFQRAYHIIITHRIDK